MKIFISIKHKLLFLLLSLQVLGLGSYFFLVSGLFKSDKTAYIFDSNATLTQSVAQEFQRTLDSAKDLTLASAGNYVDSYMSSKNKQTVGDNKLLDQVLSLSASINHVGIWLYNPETNKFNQIYTKSNLPDSQKEIENTFNSLDAEQFKSKEMTFKKIKSTDYFVAAKSYFSPSGWPYVLVQGFDTKVISTIINSSPLHKILITDSSGQVLVKSAQAELTSVESVQEWSNFKDTQKNNVPSGASVFKDPSGKEILSSYYNVASAGLKVMAMVDYDLAMRAIALLVVRSLLFLTMILSVIAMVAIVAARRLTKHLSSLTDATHHIAQGNFKIRVNTNTNDEVGYLANSFNKMASEVERLMLETAEKARMQNELQTAKLVQSTLFPKPNVDLGSVVVSGYYEPASECGGDWWNFSEVGDKVIIWIADATGHGVGPALLTSAAKSAASVIESMKITSAAEMMSIMNKAVFETAKSQILMTCAIGVIDKNKNTLTYANASHEFPSIMRKKGAELETIWLLDAQGPRLGQDLASEYTETTVELMPGDKIVLYTDGVLDIKDKAGKGYGDMKFAKSLNNLVSKQDTQPEIIIKSLVEEFNSYRSGSELVDDVTLCICEFKGSAGKKDTQAA